MAETMAETKTDHFAKAEVTQDDIEEKAALDPVVQEPANSQTLEVCFAETIGRTMFC
jgi:hypothetical protein